MWSKIGKTAKKLILAEAKRNPYLGVRKLVQLLDQKYKLKLSKSAIHKVISAKSAKTSCGNKKAALLYTNSRKQTNALVLLKALDSNIRIFDAVCQELTPYFPEIEPDQLGKIIQLISFSHYFGQTNLTNYAQPWLLRLSGLTQVPSLKIQYFLEKLKDRKPVVSLSACQKNSLICAGVKFRFHDHKSAYCDADLLTLWPELCRVPRFFSPISKTKQLLTGMIANKCLLVNYFGNSPQISDQALDFIHGASSGLEKIDLLDPDGKIVESLDFTPLVISFCLGYYPRVLAKSISGLEKIKRTKHFSNSTNEFFYWPYLARFARTQDNKGVILNNICLAKRSKALPFWGLMTDKRKNLSAMIQQYVRLWPQMERKFLENLAAMSKYPQYQPIKSGQELIPQKQLLTSSYDLAELTKILAQVFTNWIGEIDFTKSFDCNLLKSKDLYTISFPEVSVKLKSQINDYGLIFEQKRILVV